MSSPELSQVDCADKSEIVPMYDAQKLRPEALQLLELLAFLGTGLPEMLVKAIALELLPADHSGSLYDSVAYIAGRDALAAEPLIVLEGPKRKLVLLDALQNQVFATLNDTKRQRFFAGVTRKVWAEWPAALPAPSQATVLPEPKRRTQRGILVSRWPACEDLEHTTTRLEDLYPLVRTVLSDEEGLLCARLLTEAAWYQIERGFRSKVIPCLITAMEIGLATEHPDAQVFVADVRLCLGVVAMESNDFAASRANKEQFFVVVSQLCSALGVEDERLAVAYAERGVSRVQDSRYNEAIADLNASIRINRKLHGGAYVPHANEANLAWALIAQDRFEEADTLLAKSLKARRARLGDNDVESTATGQLLAAKAALRAAQLKMDDSLGHYQKAWAHLRRVVGTRDPFTARVAHQIAEHLLQLRQPEEALILVNEALNAWSVDPLANHNEEARTVYLKSLAVAALGRSETATRLREKAILQYNGITKESKDMGSIRMADFDAIVPFWSRQRGLWKA